MNTSYLEPTLERLGVEMTEFNACLETVRLAFGEGTAALRNVPIVPGLYPLSFGNLQENPVWRMLDGKVGGYSVISSLIRLGRYIRAYISVCPEDSNSIYTRLRDQNPENYMGVLFELEVHFQCFESGLRLHKRQREGADFVFERSGQKVFVEATHLGASLVQDQE